VLIGSNLEEGNLFSFMLTNRSMTMSKQQYTYLNDACLGTHGLALFGQAFYSDAYQVRATRACISSWRRANNNDDDTGRRLLARPGRVIVGLCHHVWHALDCQLACRAKLSASVSIPVLACA